MNCSPYIHADFLDNRCPPLQPLPLNFAGMPIRTNTNNNINNYKTPVKHQLTDKDYMPSPFEKVMMESLPFVPYISANYVREYFKSLKFDVSPDVMPTMVRDKKIVPNGSIMMVTDKVSRSKVRYPTVSNELEKPTKRALFNEMSETKKMCRETHTVNNYSDAPIILPSYEIIKKSYAST